MKGRVIAWVVVLGLVYVGYLAVQQWKNPLPGYTPISAVLPVMPQCGEKCK